MRASAHFYNEEKKIWGWGGGEGGGIEKCASAPNSL